MTPQLLFALEPLHSRLDAQRASLSRAGIHLRELRPEWTLSIAEGCIAALPGQLVRLRLSRNGTAPVVAFHEAFGLGEGSGAKDVGPYGCHFLADGWVGTTASAADISRVIHDATRQAASRYAATSLLSLVPPGCAAGLLAAARHTPGFGTDVTVQLVTRTANSGLVLRTPAGDTIQPPESLASLFFRGERVASTRQLADLPLVPTWATAAWVLPIPARTGETSALVALGRSRVHLAQYAATLRALSRALDEGEIGASRTRVIPNAAKQPTAALPRLLIVDDDEFLRDALTEMLQSRYEVVAAPNATMAKRLANTSPPDLVLADLGLPDSDGRTLVSWFAAHPNLPDVPILVLSGSYEREDRLKVFEVGATDYITKPFDLDELQARLERSLRVSRRLRHLREQAQTDPLTGLGNRRAFDARAREEAERATRYGFPLSIIAVDVDGLKWTNDQLGHAAGDLVIVLAAQLLAREIRSADLAARIGGDEFHVLLPHAGAEEALRLAGRLAAAAQKEIGPGNRPLSISIGVAALHPDERIEDTVERADVALREAKRSGRGQACLSRGRETAAALS